MLKKGFLSRNIPVYNFVKKNNKQLFVFFDPKHCF